MPFQLPTGIQTKSITSPPGTTVYYPQVTGLANRRVQERINEQILRATRELIHAQARYQTSRQPEMIGHYEIKTNERGLLSLTLTNYAISPHMAHGVTMMRSLTFNVNTGKQYALSDLFTPGSNYVQVISANVAAQIQKRNIPLLAPFQGIGPNQDYYLADKSVVIYFPPYTISPGYVGFPMFPISVYDLTDMAPDTSPISILAADIS
ncbi:UNVERIFIED_CONTAM: hypothetical protein ABID98_000059 [Brevibacillus sp. OAP136]